MNNYNNKGGNNDKKNLNKKKTKLYNSRTIKIQNNDSSYSKKENKLNVPDFLSSRKYEINSLELSQLKSKQALNSRCFQNLPRVMRRRAASHNVSRIPKRLRAKAIREMQGASLPAKHVPKGRKLYKLMQKQRILKAASKLKNDGHNLDDILKNGNVRKHIKEIGKELKKLDNEPNPKLNNSVGSIELSVENELASPPSLSVKYGKRQQKFAWIPTHIWHAKRFQMSKKYGFQIPYTPTQKCFKFMSRQNKHKAVCFDTSYSPIIIISPKEKDDKLVKGGLLQLYDLIIDSSDKSVLDGKNSYFGMIRLSNSVRDNKALTYFDSTNCILLIQFQSLSNFENQFNDFKENFGEDYNVTDCRYALGSMEVSGPLGLRCLSKVLHLRDESEEFKQTWATITSNKDSSLVPIGTTFSFNIYDPRLWNRPVDYPIKPTQDIYDTIIYLNSSHKVDYEVTKKLFSKQGRLDSYKNQLSIKELGKIHNQKTTLDKVNHSNIPILLTKIDSTKWKLICPWFWVLPIWIQLVKIPDIRPGGLKQIYQFNFENNQPSFPVDYPSTTEGYNYNNLVGEKAAELDSKKSKSQITLQQSESNYSLIFNAYKCDWFTLRNMLYLSKLMHNYRTTIRGREIYIPNDEDDIIYKVKLLEKEQKLISTPSVNQAQYSKNFSDNHKLNPTTMQNIVNQQLPLLTIQLKILEAGVIENNARIYSVPDYGDSFTVGFVTTGGMNLNEGKCTGIGHIFPEDMQLDTPRGKVWVRNPGKSKLYPCSYEFINT
ncbi:POP1 [Candida jiufengensis]|uniref:POP1 n=1 Tax=Candida jiufengensis TaxID=497108 RepID=UPI0022246C93|nr:POP1 [Candida jiufengensis]KAI5951169.1 POP1 [Candida jiufengensis]